MSKRDYLENTRSDAFAAGSLIENKEGTQPCRGVSFLSRRLLRLELNRVTLTLMSMSCMPSALRDMC